MEIKLTIFLTMVFNYTFLLLVIDLHIFFHANLLELHEKRLELLRSFLAFLKKILTWDASLILTVISTFLPYIL